MKFITNRRMPLLDKWRSKMHFTGILARISASDSLSRSNIWTEVSNVNLKNHVRSGNWKHGWFHSMGAISLCLAAAIFTPSLVDYCVHRNLTRESGTHCAVSKLRKGRIWGEYLLGLRTVVQIALYEYASENSKNKTESGYFTFSTIVRVTRKHWPPVHGPPLRTGSVDYLRTGPRTSPTDPSMDHPQN